MKLKRWLNSYDHLLFLQRPRLGSQHLHSGSQPSVTRVPEDLTSSSDLCRLQACTYTHEHKTLKHMGKGEKQERKEGRRRGKGRKEGGVGEGGEREY